MSKIKNPIYFLEKKGDLAYGSEHNSYTVYKIHNNLKKIEINNNNHICITFKYT